MSKDQTLPIPHLISHVISHVIQAILEGKLKLALAPDKMLDSVTPINCLNSTDISVPINTIEVYGENMILVSKKFLNVLESIFHLPPSSFFDKKIVLLETFKERESREDELIIVACKPEPSNTTYKMNVGSKSVLFINKTDNILYIPLDKIIDLSQTHLQANKGAVMLASYVTAELKKNCITLTTEHAKTVALIVLSGKTLECTSLPFANEFILEPGSLISYEDTNHQSFYAHNLSDQDLSLNIIGLIDISIPFDHS